MDVNSLANGEPCLTSPHHQLCYPLRIQLIQQRPKDLHTHSSAQSTGPPAILRRKIMPRIKRTKPGMLFYTKRKGEEFFKRVAIPRLPLNKWDSCGNSTLKKKNSETVKGMKAKLAPPARQTTAPPLSFTLSPESESPKLTFFLQDRGYSSHNCELMLPSSSPLVFHSLLTSSPTLGSQSPNGSRSFTVTF